MSTHLSDSERQALTNDLISRFSTMERNQVATSLIQTLPQDQQQQLIRMLDRPTWANDWIWLTVVLAFLALMIYAACVMINHPGNTNATTIFVSTSSFVIGLLAPSPLLKKQ